MQEEPKHSECETLDSPPFPDRILLMLLNTLLSFSALGSDSPIELFVPGAKERRGEERGGEKRGGEGRGGEGRGGEGRGGEGRGGEGRGGEGRGGEGRD